MMSFIKNLLGQRSRGFSPFRRRQPSRARRGGIALGGLATLAAPFIMRKLMARRAQQRPTGAV